MNHFDIAPFALPNSPAGELIFEEARDIQAIEITFADTVPSPIRLQYKRKVWPHKRVEWPAGLDLVRPMRFGWMPIDDLFTPAWVDAAVEIASQDGNTVCVTFQPLHAEIPEFPDIGQYDVRFRRTVGVRVISEANAVRSMRVFTCSTPARSRIRVELHAGRRTPTSQIRLEGYNALVRQILPNRGVRANEAGIWVDDAQTASFELEIDHMEPAHRYSHDDAHLRFDLDSDAFTISLSALDAEGPIWFAEQGIYIARSDDSTSFCAYRARIAGTRTVAQQVAARSEQSLAGAMNGQPRPHPIAYCFGCKHARQKFRIEPCGDLCLTAWPLLKQPGRDTPRWKNRGDARWLFGFDRWAVEGRYNDPWPVMAYNLRFRRDEIRAWIQCFAVPLKQSILLGEPAPDDPIVALMRFRFENVGDQPATAELPISYSNDAPKSRNRRDELAEGRRTQTDTLVPFCEYEKLKIEGDCIIGTFEESPVLRMVFETDMRPDFPADQLRFRKELAPGTSCDFLARIPYIALETESELAELRRLEWNRCYDEMARYWRAESCRGAQIHTPDPHLNALYAGHLPMVLMTDFGHPDGSGLVNTSVGTTTYGNFANESVMIIEELAQRGLTDEVRRRLAIWTRYQSTVGLLGRFTDHDGVFYGAGGLESGQSYNQHHGWVLWALARHYLDTDDREWFAGVVENVVHGAEWIIRQRRQTMAVLPHSRGWEYGFLPAGALEDVDDFFYWLSTNCLTWRGLDSAAQALERYGHPQAARYREEADAYRRDLRRGFEIARQHSPLIRLRDGRWIPHYPSRLYCRGRDQGWIREVLEGSIYLLLSGLYEPTSREAAWILDDYLDTRYMNPPFGYRIEDPQTQWFDCGGFSAQPNLLAGLLPHLDRDEIEIYLWMFFNAWAACYREEVQAMVEHPQPVLGFSNAAPFKTSDQSNAIKWLAYMFVYERNGLLHLGRAVPRAWFESEKPFGVKRLGTSAGKVTLTYRPSLNARQIEADVELELRHLPQRILLRFRHPHKRVIREALVGGRPHPVYDAEKGDVELPSISGRVSVAVYFD